VFPRRLYLFAVLAILTTLLVAPASGRNAATRAASPSAVTFVISGRGWGHGVGLAQYGALGFAKRGVTYDRILAHFYRGTELDPAPVTRVRVLLYEQRPKVKITSETAFRLQDPTGDVRTLAAGTAVVTGGPTVTTADGKEKLEGPLTFLRGTTPLSLDGRSYRGSLEISAVGKRLRVINVVGIDRYLYGVITQEMPHDWPPAALQAQAVAARSYALANRYSGEFDLYADVRSQVYGGIAAETATSRAAVDATAREVLSYGGKVANTYFFSSSGGRTANVTEVWGTKQIPYLVSVKDPYDTASPYHRWGPVGFTAAQAAKALKIPGLQDLVPEIGPSGRARIVFADTVIGRTVVRGSDFRRALELRSTWVTIGRMALDRPAGPVAAGTEVPLTGGVRGLKGVVLEQRVLGGEWQTGTAVPVAANGRFALTVNPAQTTEYRLRSGLATGQAVRVLISP
jgi:stage II sporulation protein D